MRKDISSIFGLIVIILGIFVLFIIILQYIQLFLILTFIVSILSFWYMLNWACSILIIIGGIILFIGSNQVNKSRSSLGLGLSIGAWVYFLIYSINTLISIPMAINIMNFEKIHLFVIYQDILDKFIIYRDIIYSIFLFSLLMVSSIEILMQNMIILSMYLLCIVIPCIPLGIISNVKVE